MVFFTCGNCGESIKKPSIAKHYMGKCRGPINVTCVDCFKDFRGNEYEAHIKCVTEEERYAAKGFVPKASSNKGEKKQQTWFEAVQNILNSERGLKNDERELLQLLSNHENLPRKKGKFINFLTNAHRAYARRQDLVERVWSIIEEAGKAATANGTKETVKTQEGDEKSEKNSNGEVQGSKKSKRKSEIENGETVKKQKLDNGLADQAKKSKKKSEDSEAVMTKPKINTHDLVCNIIQEAGDSLSLGKLIKAIEKHCESETSVEKAPKLLKKIYKHISVTVKDSELRLECQAIN